LIPARASCPNSVPRGEEPARNRAGGNQPARIDQAGIAVGSAQPPLAMAGITSNPRRTCSGSGAYRFMFVRPAPVVGARRRNPSYRSHRDRWSVNQGDVDILLRVSAPRFQATVKVLSEHFASTSVELDGGVCQLWRRYRLSIAGRNLGHGQRFQFGLLALSSRLFQIPSAALREYDQLKVARRMQGPKTTGGQR